VHFFGSRVSRAVFAGAVALVLAACCSCGGSAAAGSSGGTAGPRFSLSEIRRGFSAMRTLKRLAAAGHGRIAVLLPEAANFATVDRPALAQSFRAAGLKASDFTVQLPQGSDQLHAAKAAIAGGARTLIVDARYSGDGTRIEAYAKAHGVPVIDYDWLTLGGARSYYVGFDSLKIGVLQGLGLVRCAALWGVKKPQVMIMSGSPDDYNVALYTRGYDTILKRYFAAGTWQDVSNPPGTWLALTSLTEFERQYQAHPNINAALIPNDENATPIIGFLEQHIKARTFPVTGLDATASGLQNILAGYQCGTVYKPVYLEAQAAAALALYLRARVRPPAGLVNWPITDPQTNRPVPSALLTPVWVTMANMRSVVMNDHVVPVAELCTPQFAADCAKAGIPAS
jgi:D-xylose transport system substrate-binding protein